MDLSKKMNIDTKLYNYDISNLDLNFIHNE